MSKMDEIEIEPERNMPTQKTTHAIKQGRASRWCKRDGSI